MGGQGHEVTSVVIAAAQSVAKVFVIGAAGALAVVFPRGDPFLPAHAVGLMARFCFHTLVVPLIYSTTAMSVSISSMSNYWFVAVSAFFVLAVSYWTATLLARCPGLRIRDPCDFCALRISATFPNIVALPILIFPSLCEYPVVYQGFAATSSSGGNNNTTTSNPTDAELSSQCLAQANTMIFCYFFAWSVIFWSWGNPQLMAAAHLRAKQLSDPAITATRDSLATTGNPLENVEEGDENDPASNQNSSTASQLQEVPAKGKSKGEVLRQVDSSSDREEGLESPGTEAVGPAEICPTPASALAETNGATPPGGFYHLRNALYQTCTSPGFVALAAGFVTGCIPWLQQALFHEAGALRFVGGALETLGEASSPMSTMVVAASLVPMHAIATAPVDPNSSSMLTRDAPSEVPEGVPEVKSSHDGAVDRSPVAGADQGENPIMSDPNFGPHRRQPRPLRRLSASVRRRSSELWRKAPRASPDLRRLLLWFVLSRLVVAPALVVMLIVGLDCHTSLLRSVPPLGKLVVIVNSCLPGALIVVVLLKSNPALSLTAAAVARVYLPSYLLSIVTIAAWTSVGMLISLPNDQGTNFCLLK